MRGENVKIAQIIKNHLKWNEKINDVLLGLWPNISPRLIGTYSHVFEANKQRGKHNQNPSLTGRDKTASFLTEMKLDRFSLTIDLRM